LETDTADSQDWFEVDAEEEVLVDFNRFTETNSTSFRIQNHIKVKSH